MSSAPPEPPDYGSLWIDAPDAPAEIERRAAAGEFDARLAQRLASFERDGFIVLPGAVEGALVEELLADVERAWQTDDDRVRVEYPAGGEIRIAPPSAELRAGPHKLLNMHAVSAAARAALFCPDVLEFLSALYGRPPMCFSTLLFERGTGQPIHQDTAYVAVTPPMELAASWIALEDVVEGSGELEYFRGSHRIPPRDFGGTRLMPIEQAGDEAYHYDLFAACQELGCEHVRFRPSRGDALIWHADLVHGGSALTRPELTRRSLVTHYCPADREPDYFGFWRHSGKLQAPEADAKYCHYWR